MDNKCAFFTPTLITNYNDDNILNTNLFARNFPSDKYCFSISFSFFFFKFFLLYVSTAREQKMTLRWLLAKKVRYAPNFTIAT